MTHATLNCSQLMREVQENLSTCSQASTCLFCLHRNTSSNNTTLKCHNSAAGKVTVQVLQSKMCHNETLMDGRQVRHWCAFFKVLPPSLYSRRHHSSSDGYIYPLIQILVSSLTQKNHFPSARSLSWSGNITRLVCDETLKENW